MILENPFSQKDFESTFLEGGTLTENLVRRKRRNRLFIKKVNEYERSSLILRCKLISYKFHWF